MFTRRQRLIGIAAVTALALLGCSNSTDPVAPYEPQINNVTDNFQFQATDVTDITWTYTYQWLNTGDSATVNQATAVNGGSATLTISDSTGTQLYSKSLSANGTFGMIKGAAGHWTVRVQFFQYAGTVNFRVQKQ
jgi:PBP1b-binding outer membrane lipoprotein LpoB